MYSKNIILIWGIACVIAVLSDNVPPVIPILDQSDEWEANGTYKYSYETGNGIKREEEIYNKMLPKIQGRNSVSSNEGGESEENNEIHVQRGSYSYTAPDGTVISISYIADENGFRPINKHLLRGSKTQAISNPTDSFVSVSELKVQKYPSQAPENKIATTEKPEISSNTTTQVPIETKSVSLEQSTNTNLPQNIIAEIAKIETITAKEDSPITSEITATTEAAQQSTYSENLTTNAS